MPRSARDTGASVAAPRGWSAGRVRACASEPFAVAALPPALRRYRVEDLETVCDLNDPSRGRSSYGVKAGAPKLRPRRDPDTGSLNRRRGESKKEGSGQ